MRAVFWMATLGALAAGSAEEIVTLMFGQRFGPSAPLLLPLVGSMLSLVFISVCTSILIAYGQPRWVFALTVPLVPAAIVGHVLVIPRLGPPGAALVMLAISTAGAAAAAIWVKRLTRLSPPWATLLRCLTVAALLFALARFWPAPGWQVLIKLSALAAAALGLLALLGEFSAVELAGALAYLRQPFQAAWKAMAREA